MSELDDLRWKRAELDRQISAAESSENLKRYNQELDSHYVKVACDACAGSAVSLRMGSDNTDMDEWPCESCHGFGFLYARKWEGKQEHDMTHNQVFGV